MRFSTNRHPNYESGFDQYSRGFDALAEAGDKIEERRRSRHDEKQGDENHGKNLEMMALRIADLEDALKNRPADRARIIEKDKADIVDRDLRRQADKDDRDIRNRAIDLAAAAANRKTADDDRARAARAAAIGALGGGGGLVADAPPASPSNAGMQGPVLPGQPAPWDDNPDVGDHMSDTDRMFGAIAPFAADMDEDTFQTLVAPLMKARSNGLLRIRRQQMSSNLAKAVEAGYLDDAGAADGAALLESGDAVAIDKFDKSLMALKDAHEEKMTDDMLKQSSVGRVEGLLASLPAIGVNLDRSKRAQIEAMRVKLASPFTSADDADRLEDKIRDLVFKDAAGGSGGGKAWHEHPAVLKKLEFGTPEEAAALARQLGLEGVPNEAAPQGGAPASEPLDPEDVKSVVGLRAELEDQLGREPSDEEVADEIMRQLGGSGSQPVSADAPSAADVEKARATLRDKYGMEPTPEEVNAKVVSDNRAKEKRQPWKHYPGRTTGIEVGDRTREFLKSVIGKMPKTQAEKDAGLAHFEKLLDETESPGYREKLQVARYALTQIKVSGAQDEFVKNEPGKFSEEDARKQHRADDRLVFKKNPRGGYDLVGKNDLLRHSDPKGSLINQ